MLIDPVLSLSTYLGGSGFDAAYGVAADGSGNIYVTGETASADFPLPARGTRTARAGRDAFVTKLSPDGSVLLYTTILSSSGNDAGRAIAVDAAGNAYIAGVAGSNFPVTTGALRTSPGGQEDGFVAKLDPAGRLVYATYLGDAGADFAAGIAVDSSGNAYVTGYTSSLRFPTTPGAPQTAYQGGYYDAFLVKLDASGRTLLYSTLLGGPGNDLARAVAVGAAGNACLAGYTDSLGLPVRNAFKSTPAGGGDALVACLNASGTAWNYLTYFGGTSMDEAYGVAVDAAGNAHVAGATFSVNFPVSLGAFQSVKRNGYDAFVAKFSPGGALVYSTLLGGGGTDTATAVAVDGTGRAWIAGFTASLDFPVAEAWQTTARGSFDAFVAQLSPDGTSLMGSSYLGGSGDDRAWGVALGSAGSVVVAGMTGSTDFPTTSGTVQPGALAPYNAFVTRLIGNQAPAVQSVSPASGSGSSQTFTVTVADPNGYGDIYTVYFLIDTTISGVSACFVAYLPAQQRLLLMNDGGTQWLAPLTPGVVGSASNSQCTLNAATSSVSASGSTLTLRLALLFQASFAGQKSTYVAALDRAGLSSGWITTGSWTPYEATNQPPQGVSVSPSSGSGASQTFTVTAADPNGYGDIYTVYFLVDRTISGVSACFVAYLPTYNRLLLMNDGGTQWLAPLIPGVAGSASNSQCTLNAATSSVSASGSTLTLRLALLFQASFAGQKSIYLAAVDRAALSSGWISAGSWMIP